MVYINCVGMIQQRSITLMIDEIGMELEMDSNLTLYQLEEFMKEADFRAASEGYGIHTIFKAGDNLSFRYNSPEAQPSLKHLSLKQFHPKKKLVFYITKENLNVPHLVKL